MKASLITAVAICISVGVSGSKSNVAFARDAGKASDDTRAAVAGLALQGGDHYSFKIGDIAVIALSDGTVPQDLHELLRNTTNEKTDQLLSKNYLTNPVEASINSYLIKSAGTLILVDVGAGDFFGPGYGGKLLKSLAAIDVKPEEITDILLTHAHDDHMGGLVHLGKLVFPNAVVHLNKADFDFFTDRSNAEKSHYAISYFDQAAVALLPEIKAGKIKTFSDDSEVLPGVRSESHPGHTPGSVFYTLTSKGQSLVFTGDIVHVPSVQGPNPEVTIAYDVDEKMAAKVRATAFAQFARTKALLAVPHVSFPGVGHIEAVGGGYRWVAIDYGNRATGSSADFADPHKSGDK